MESASLDEPFGRGVTETVVEIEGAVGRGVTEAAMEIEEARTSATRPRRLNPRWLTDSTEAALTFGTQRGLLRATTLSTVMRSRAALLENSDGSAETYSLSQEVTAIDDFISHNWCVPRMSKFLCLALHYNLSLALLAATAALAFMFMLGHFGIGFPKELSRALFLLDQSQGFVQCGIEAKIVVPLVFLFFCVFGQELLPYPPGVYGRRLFLDKVCIDQTSAERKREGINKLGAVLRYSSHMVALYSEFYLQKLWTVYEVACFLSFHPTSRLIVMPMYKPALVLGGAALWSLISVIRIPLLRFGGDMVLLLLVEGALQLAGSVALLRWWKRERAGIVDRISTFDIRQCSCSCEEDRRFVYHNIASFMRATGNTQTEASECQALDAFNSFVRAQLDRSLIASISPLGLHYREMATLLLLAYGPDIVDTFFLGEVTHDEEWILRWRINGAVIYATVIFCAGPVSIALASQWCGLCPQLQGCREVAFLMVGTVLVVLFYVLPNMGLAFYMMEGAVRPGRYREIWEVGEACSILFFIMQTIYCYYPGWRSAALDEEVEDEHSNSQ